MKPIVTSEEYRVSERVKLSPGDVFRATGGPYWKGSDGAEISLKAAGPYRFVQHCKRGAVEWIEAKDKAGNHCVLHVAGKRKRIDGCLVPRPYRVTGKKRTQLQRLDNKKRRR